MGIIIDVYRNDGQDCTNNGVSANHSRLTVVNVPGPFEPSENAPAVKLVKGAFDGCAKIVPVDLEGRHTMFGGNYGATSDSRFSNALREITGYEWPSSAVAIHDRVEW